MGVVRASLVAWRGASYHDASALRKASYDFARSVRRFPYCPDPTTCQNQPMVCHVCPSPLSFFFCKIISRTLHVGIPSHRRLSSLGMINWEERFEAQSEVRKLTGSYLPCRFSRFAMEDTRLSDLGLALPMGSGFVGWAGLSPLLACEDRSGLVSFALGPRLVYGERGRGASWLHVDGFVGLFVFLLEG